MSSRRNSTSVKRKPYRPPPIDYRNTERGKEWLEQMIRESQQKDAKKGEHHD